MNKEAYYKVKYSLKSCPEFAKKDSYSEIYYLIYDNGMAGNEIVLFDNKLALEKYQKNIK